MRSMILVGSALAGSLLIAVSAQANTAAPGTTYGKASDISALLARRGADDGPTHDVGDDRGRGRGRGGRG